jgi:uroporphyrinogen III methyltransferase / synthase
MAGLERIVKRRRFRESGAMSRARAGTVYLVGAGPGDPGLITSRALELVRSADVVLHDELVDDAILAEVTGELEYAGKRGTPDSVPGERPRERALTQAAIDARVLYHAKLGRSVVRLKGGDPYLFGRGSEEAMALVAAGVPFEVVPGVPSPTAAAAYAGFSLTHRELASSVTFLSATMRDGTLFDFAELRGVRGTLCLFMAHRRLAEVCEALMREAGRSSATPTAVIRAATRTDQVVIDAPLGEVAALLEVQALRSPVLFVVGAVTAQRSDLRWFDGRPLFGRGVLSLRTSQQSAETAREIRRRGARAHCVPLIETRRIEPSVEDAVRLAAPDRYDVVAFTSENAVDAVFDRLAASGRDLRAFGRARLAAIGDATRDALARRGAKVDIVALESVNEGLAATIQQSLGDAAARSRVLLPRARIARESLVVELERAGVVVDVVPVYETHPRAEEARAELAELLRARRVDVVLLTSSSIAEAFADATEPADREGIMIASIGPITTKTAERRGLSVSVTSEKSHLGALLDAVEAALDRQ